MKLIDYDGLSAPFPPNDIEWRVGHASKKTPPTCTLLAYLTARAVMDRLDAVVGPSNWQDAYSPGPDGGIMCSIAVWDGAKECWISKSDGAENTNIEAIKGGYSGAFKRAAVKWGIGRYLYSLGTEWHDTVEHFSAKKNGVDYIKAKIGGDWVFVKRPDLPEWALPEQPKDPSWYDDQAAFCSELSNNGLKYEDVASWCKEMGRPRPSRMDSTGRSRLLDYLNSKEGLDRFSSWRNG
tara:strand:- start:1086 stop:1796 length:711 start_codon:yes stop_codon:yes gene_type:complete